MTREVGKEYKAFSVSVEPVIIKGKSKLVMGMRVLNPYLDTYSLFESEVPKSSFLGKEIARLHKEALKQLKDLHKKKDE